MLLLSLVGLLATTGPARAATSATTTTVTCPDPATVGTAAACSVAVVAADGVLPTGSVALGRNSSGALAPSSCPLVDSGTPGRATCDFTYTPGGYGSGQHKVYANYPGDGGHARSYGFVAFTVVLTAGRTTTTAVTCSPNPVSLLSRTTCTATVTDTAPDPAHAGAPTGSVSFGRNSLDASFDTPSCTLSPAGPTTASCTDGYTPTGVDTGMQKIYANYAGDAAHAVSHSSTVVTVQDIPPAAGPVSFSGAVGNTVFGVGTTPATPSSTASGTVLSNSSDQDGDPIAAVAGTIATAKGGSVALRADGTFTYTPPAGAVGDDTFMFTVSDGALTSAPATATIHVANRVWYVKNNDAGANDGRSVAPFHTLGQAQAASGANDFIYVFKGDGTATGQSSGIALKSGQRLLGETRDLVVGGVSLFTGNAANRPLIAAASGNAITLANDVTVAGLAANAGGSANGITGTGVTGTIVIADTTVDANQTVDTGFDNAVTITNGGGTLNLSLTSDTLRESSPTVGNDALNITTTGAATVNPTISGTSITAARGDLFQLNIGGTSSSTLSFMNNTLSNNNTNIVSGGGGVSLSAGGGAGATLNFDVQSNTFRDAVGNAVGIGSASGANTVKGTFSNNTIGVPGVANSGSLQGSDLVVAGADGIHMGITVEHNNVYQYNNFGISFQTTKAVSLDAKVDNNTIANPGNNAPGFFGSGLQLNAGTATGDTNAICFDAFANSLAGSGFGGGFDIKLRQRQSTTVRLPGYPGPGVETATAFTIAQNTPPAPTAVTTGSFGGGGACTGL